jgi:type II secretory pathway pseudopilin PulG
LVLEHGGDSWELEGTPPCFFFARAAFADTVAEDSMCSNTRCQSVVPIRSSVGRRRAAFSLIEALVALTITSLAGAVLCLSVQSSLSSTSEAVDQTIADGVAQQTLDEILTKRYVGAGDPPLLTTLGPATSELLGGGTSLFDDTDDYAGYIAQPLKGSYGETLGTGDDSGNPRLANFRVRSDFFQNWRVRVDEYYVDPTDHTVHSSTPTNFRAIEVHVELTQTGGAVLPLASRKRIIAYIPPPSS